MRTRNLQHSLIEEDKRSIDRYFRYKWVLSLSFLAFLFFLWELFIPYLKVQIYHQVSIYPLMVGFFLATARSCYKDCLLFKKEEKDQEDIKEIRKKLAKPFWAWFWTYFVNYLIILSLIYILGNFLRDYKDYPVYVCWAIIFGLGYFVDDVFRRPLAIFGH